MTQHPRVSIIVPVYRTPPAFLLQCLESLRAQTLPAVEFILVDDASPDRCPDILREFAALDPRFRPVFHTTNRGVSAARNSGLTKAEGDYIGFIDSDDWVDPSMFKSLLKRAETTDADIAWCGIRRSRDMAATPADAPRDHVFENVRGNIAAIRHAGQSCCNKLFRRSVLRGMEFFDIDHGEDGVFILEALLRSQRAATLAASLYVYRTNHASATNRNVTLRVIEDIQIACRTRMALCRQYSIPLPMARSIWRHINQTKGPAVVASHILSRGDPTQKVALWKAYALLFLSDLRALPWAARVSYGWYKLIFGLPGIRLAHLILIAGNVHLLTHILGCHLRRVAGVPRSAPA